MCCVTWQGIDGEKQERLVAAGHVSSGTIVGVLAVSLGPPSRSADISRCAAKEVVDARPRLEDPICSALESGWETK